ncbi:putative translation initiation factor 4a [Acanthamoeba castellanii mimivirus]|jgi:superfamily II DNA/RNA helicase|uniref:Putative ATP-dependent RNA helicase R458 n=5 Tax=Mimivirus TaxID=315393 RepID=YR458_MIMIV|nr:putative translation initiation factor 4a [Acanthamoeba polyphaga mimivirus]Q5UQD1.1 RecName: Full=Putative ATP-dependent RNA helicase R458 [Acanthamoeba polyphaga mimivirus]AEQ60645.1 DEAD/SNF2-like helicase [Acanthamoeba castellanii mamavirus]AHA45401.1 putative translation initiation factor 4a [Hirudovirus strain Sangsue]AHJ40143.1 translation initiation factor 4a [Samba virus]ALR84048.1 DEAD/SNF2-like helicase [Niemeyer virus]AMZ02902.1 putative translation initiation factor 4a [Mimivi
MNSDQENINSYNFESIKIGDYKCNVNRIPGDNLYLLSNFNDAEPKYDDKNGVHLEFNYKKIGESKTMRLNDGATSTVLIEGARNMNANEYFPKFVEKKKSFAEHLIRKTFAKGYESPSEIQALVVPELIQRKDTLIQFKSGTGKTHAFLFGCLWGFDPDDDVLQYIFITSSHEVATQIYEQAVFLLPETAKIALCIGQKKSPNSFGNSGFKTPIGTSSLNHKPKSIKEEREEIRQAQIIICTMGRFYDILCNKGWITTTRYLKAICVDEFDNIVASKTKQRSSTVMNTEDQMAEIIQKIESEAPKNSENGAQRVFFSATVSPYAIKIANSYFRKYSPIIGEPFIVLLDSEDYTLEGIRQYYVQCSNYFEKKEIILDLLKQCRIAQAIIFANRIETANEIKKLLDEQEVPISSAVFHGDLPAVTRKNIHKDFVENKIRLLISTDLTSRGLDVQGINVVFNFDMPDTLETYIHRVGRSGRYGRKGVSISLILVNQNKNEMEKVEQIDNCSKQSKMSQLPGDLSTLL